MSVNPMEGVDGATSTSHFSAPLLFLVPVAQPALFSEEALVASMIATSTKLRAFAL